MATTTTYDQNIVASKDTTFINNLAAAMADAARDIQNENPASLSLPTGYNKGSDDTAKKQNLHEERVSLSYYTLGEPEGYAIKYAVSAAVSMDVYVSGIVRMANDDLAPENSDYDTVVSTNWNAWSVTADTLTE